MAVVVESFEDLIKLLEQGDEAKRRAATAMNERSTRAHTLMILSLRQRKRSHKFNNSGKLSNILADVASSSSSSPPPRPKSFNTNSNAAFVESKLFLADLGGAERLSKSKVDDEVKATVVMVGGQEVSRITWEEYYKNRERTQEALLINQG